MLPTLAADERKAVQAALVVLGGPITVQDDRATTIVYVAISAELAARGERVYSVGTYLKHKAFRREAMALLDYVRAHVKPPDRTQEMAVLRKIIRMLIDHLETTGKPIGQNDVLWSLGKAAAILEANFPGYRESGLLPRVLLRREGSS